MSSASDLCLLSVRLADHQGSCPVQVHLVDPLAAMQSEDEAGLSQSQCDDHIDEEGNQSTFHADGFRFIALLIYGKLIQQSMSQLVAILEIGILLQSVRADGQLLGQNFGQLHGPPGKAGHKAGEKTSQVNRANEFMVGCPLKGQRPTTSNEPTSSRCRPHRWSKEDKN